MDADLRIIPIVEDDQGEGIKDPLTMDDIAEIYKEGSFKADYNYQKVFWKQQNLQKLVHEQQKRFNRKR